MLGLHFGDIVLTVIILAIVFGWSFVPRLGERIGRLLSGGGPDA